VIASRLTQRRGLLGLPSLTAGFYGGRTHLVAGSEGVVREYSRRLEALRT
jgi:hypothetical protein